MPLLLALYSLIAFEPSARAELWQGAETLGHRELTSGAFAEIYSATSAYPFAYMVFGQLAYGQSDRWQLEGRIGFGMIDVAFGAFAKYLIHSENGFALAVHGGVRKQIILTSDFSFIASLRTGPWEFYGSPSLLLPLQGNPIALSVIPGISRAFGKLHLYLESNINVANATTTGSFGFRHFF